jgi:hypothetical protein
VEIVQHVNDDTLERYAMQVLPESEVGPMEEHLLICPDCRERLQAEIDYVTAMRDAAADLGGIWNATSRTSRVPN